jgi:hypothetical protein
VIGLLAALVPLALASPPESELEPPWTESAIIEIVAHELPAAVQAEAEPPQADASANEPAEDWSAWDTPTSTPTATTHDSESESDDDKRDKLKVGDVLAGSLRLTGSFLHYDDVPELFPAGDDALVFVVGRVLVEADAGKHVHFTFNGFGEVARAPVGSNLGGSFASAGSTASAYRTRYLNWNFWQNGAIAGQLGVDRAAIRMNFDSIRIELGRFPITYAVTGMLTTNDFFAPFSATAVNRIYKPGVDAARVSVGLTPTASIDVLGVLGYDPKSDRPSWARTAVFTRAAFVGAGFEWALLGGKVSQRWVAGGSLQGDAGRVNLRAEFHVGIPDEQGDGRDRDDRPIYGRVAAGPSMNFAWQNATIAAEYLYASDGAAKPSGYVDRALASYSDDLPYFGRHHVAAAMSMEIIPILRVAFTGLVCASDGSGLAGISFIYNVADESDLILGVFVPWGKGLQGIDLVSMQPVLGSEFGLAPISAYLEMRVFF